MDLENKEEIIQPMRDEELENASGGYPLTFYCRSCGWQTYNPPDDDICPQCGSEMEALFHC